ncbi:MAG: AMP-binding protein [Cryomorphaceae bacterium]
MSDTPEWKKYKSLSIDGRKRSLHEWRAYAQQQLQEGYGIGDLEDILEFVVDWSSTKEWIPARTSGSTGRPKNIKIRKEHILASAKRTLDFLGLKPGDSALLCMPNRFIGGKMMIARSIIGDLDLHIADTTAMPELPKGKSIDFAAVVPMQLYNITEDEEATDRWKKVKKIIVGGGQVDPRLEERVGKWPNEIYESFGMTETISHVALRRINGKDRSAPFQVLDGIEIEMDERGCLVLKSDLLPQNPLVTNDIINMETERAFHWVGRADNMINSGGVKIIPEVIEKLAKHYLNTKFFFTGLPDEKLGERVVLVIESQIMSAEDQEELMTDLKKDLHKHELPKEIIFLDAFAETENGKLNRKKTISLIPK